MYKKFIKRMIDLALSTIGIIVLTPFWIILGIAIKVNDPGPVFFKQKRIAKDKNGEEQFFQIYKYRTMKVSTPKDMPTHLLTNPEQYITKVGGFLRKTSLDGYDIIGQTRKSLENRGFREVSLMNFLDNHTRFGWYSCDMRIATV